MDDIGGVAAAMNAQFSGWGIILVGFADNMGTPEGNLALSKQRAAAGAEQMQRHGITPALITGFGQELPVADNSTPEGCESLVSHSVVQSGQHCCGCEDCWRWRCVYGSRRRLRVWVDYRSNL